MCLQYTYSSYIRISQFAEVRSEVIPQSLPGSRERHSTDEDDEEEQVGEWGSEVHYL